MLTDTAIGQRIAKTKSQNNSQRQSADTVPAQSRGNKHADNFTDTATNQTMVRMLDSHTRLVINLHQYIIRLLYNFDISGRILTCLTEKRHYVTVMKISEIDRPMSWIGIIKWPRHVH